MPKSVCNQKSFAELCYDTSSTEHTKYRQRAAGAETNTHTNEGGTHRVLTLGCRSPELRQTYK